MAKNEIKYSDYSQHYSPNKLMAKVRSAAAKAGIKVIYVVLLLYYILKSESVSTKDKTIIVGALGYFILPVDLIPDVIIGVGYTDDFAVLVAYKAVKRNITPEIERQAQAKLCTWFPDYSSEDIKIDEQ